MTLIRSSISINKELFEQAKQLAEAADTTLSGLVSRLLKFEVEQKRRVRDAWAEIEELNRQAFEEAAKMTEEDMWGDTPPLSPEEERALEAQIAKVNALAEREGRP